VSTDSSPSKISSELSGPHEPGDGAVTVGPQPGTGSLQPAIPAMGRLELGSPMPGQESLMWEGRPSFAYSVPSFIKSAVFFSIWGFLYIAITDAIDVPIGSEAVGTVRNELDLDAEAEQALVYVGYGLLFFMFLNVLRVIKTILRHVNTWYTITTQRIVIRTGILSLTSKQIELFRLKDYSSHQSLWARVFRYANLHVVSSDRLLPNAVLWGLPMRGNIVEMIRRAAQVARAEHGSVTITE